MDERWDGASPGGSESRRERGRESLTRAGGSEGGRERGRGSEGGERGREGARAAGGGGEAWKGTKGREGKEERLSLRLSCSVGLVGLWTADDLPCADSRPQR